MHVPRFDTSSHQHRAFPLLFYRSRWRRQQHASLRHCLPRIRCVLRRQALAIAHRHIPTVNNILAILSGDTSASEIGILSTSQPRLVTTGRLVPPGTNGAVTLLGTAASATAGAVIGTSFGVCELLLEGGRLWVLHAALIGALAGLCGSLVDSVLGATLQYSALEANGKRVLSSRTEADAMQGSRHISGRDILSNAQVGSRCSSACSSQVTIGHRSTWLQRA
jgi:uncharacterized membrane protein